MTLQHVSSCSLIKECELLFVVEEAAGREPGKDVRSPFVTKKVHDMCTLSETNKMTEEDVQIR